MTGLLLLMMAIRHLYSSLGAEYIPLKSLPEVKGLLYASPNLCPDFPFIPRNTHYSLFLWLKTMTAF